jgi:phytoene dehydrogenase-like protein
MGTKPDNTKSSYECVVIGAGNGGLGAAARLAAKGVQVLLLEQHNLPGGFATSFVRGRFEFEASLHSFCEIGSPAQKGSVREFLEDELGIMIDWYEIPEAFRLILTDPGENLDVVVPFGVENFINTIEKAIPGSRQVVSGYITLCKEVNDAFTYIENTKGKPDKKVLLKHYSNFLKTCPYTVDQVADALKIPEQVRKILHAEWCYVGPPTSRINFSLYAVMLYRFLIKSAYIPGKRSHEYTRAFVRRIRELGGRVEFNTRVRKILVHKGRVTGVVTSLGDYIETDHIISNASPTLVYNHLIHPRESVPEIAYKECRARVNGMSACVVYLGLDASPGELGLHEYSYFIFNHMNTDILYETGKDLEAPCFQAAICLNNALPDCSPPGTTIVSIITLVHPDVWKQVAPHEYHEIKRQLADSLITHFENATGTQIREHIEEIEIATPATYVRYTGAYKGIIYGYEPEPWDSLIPRAMTFHDEISIKGLRFCGGYTFFCHGYSSSLMSGVTAGLITYQEIKEMGDVSV